MDEISSRLVKLENFDMSVIVDGVSDPVWKEPQVQLFWVSSEGEIENFVWKLLSSPW